MTSEVNLTTLQREMLDPNFKAKFEESYFVPKHCVISCKKCNTNNLEGEIVRPLQERETTRFTGKGMWLNIWFLSNIEFVEELIRAAKLKKKKIYFLHKWFKAHSDTGVILCKNCKCAELVKSGSKQKFCTRCKNNTHKKKFEEVYISSINVSEILRLGAIKC
jgi:hypothetical protein